MSEQEQNSQNTAKVIYLLYIGNIMIQFLGIIGVVVAYVYKDDAPEWLQSHYQFLIRTFWIGLLYGVILIPFFFIGIGFFLLPLLAIWFLIRCVKGIKYLDQKQPHPNPTTWMFS